MVQSSRTLFGGSSRRGGSRSDELHGFGGLLAGGGHPNGYHGAHVHLLYGLGQTDDLAAIHALGKGWVAEEALAIAIYCALRYGHDIAGALIAAVNHEGDSDSTGSITGNIIGAKIGYSNIPSKYTETLEMRDVILRVADEMFKYGL